VRVAKDKLNVHTPNNDHIFVEVVEGLDVVDSVDPGTAHNVDAVRTAHSVDAGDIHNLHAVRVVRIVDVGLCIC
jgi:hypothetical protein